MREIQILRDIANMDGADGYITRFFEAYNDDTHTRVVLAMEAAAMSLYRFCLLQPKFMVQDESTKKFIKELFGAVVFLQQHDILHRDVTEANILLHLDGPSLRAKLADFGTACYLNKLPEEADKTRG